MNPIAVTPKKIAMTILFLFANCFLLFSQTPQWEWAKSANGSNSEYARSVSTDANGNVYMAGDFWSGTITFDTTTLTNKGKDDIFLVKYAPDGNVLWAKNAGGSDSSDYAQSVSTDTNGNVYMAGNFESSTITFDTTTLTNKGGYDIFLVKYAPDGNVLWAKNAGGSNDEHATSVSTDANGNVYMAGYFGSGTITFDTTTLTNTVSIDIFLVKYAPDGNVLWAKNAEGSYDEYAGSVSTDANGNVYMAGSFWGSTISFDTTTLTNTGGRDIFLVKYAPDGNMLWVKNAGGSNYESAQSVSTDANGNVYMAGHFWSDTITFDTTKLTKKGGYDIFLVKYAPDGNVLWAKNAGGSSYEYAESVSTDANGNVYMTGYFESGTITFGTTTLTKKGGYDIFLVKYAPDGNVLWAKSANGSSSEYAESVSTDANGNVYMAGNFFGATITFDSNTLTNTGSGDIFLVKLRDRGASGIAFNDLSNNCVQDSSEVSGLAGFTFIVNPGNSVVQTNSNGVWYIDSLPAGNYTITARSTDKWLLSCPDTQSFTITNSGIFTAAPAFGFVSTEPCGSPDVTIYAPFLRPCFNQNVYVQACNQYIATGTIDSAYVEVQLDSLLTLQSASLAYSALGNNKYRFDVGTLNPGICASFTMSCLVNCNAMLGQTLCMKADLYPADSCVFDTITNPFPPGITPCNLPWDKSSLMVEAACVNDSIRFVVYNTGDSINGNMACHAPVRLYIDGQFTLMDSIQLAGGDSIVYTFSGDGRTWRLEADQHPKHPGNSHPNATIEACGNTQNWTPDLVNLLPMNDADPVTDIYCGLVTGSYDPNDKTGYPYGVTDSNYIYPNQELQYVIRFQNTGTDTAFSVVVRDTLDDNLDIFTVTAGVSSHDYTFKMHGPRVLEWTFDNILLPDSITNKQNSYGFVSFTVNQNPDLSNGTPIQNKAGIYFDFNTPVLTNQTLHTVNDMLQVPQFVTQTLLNKSACESYTYNGFTYNTNGTYIQNFKSSEGLDSTVSINLTINNISSSVINPTACVSYTAPSGAIFTTSGAFSDTIPNSTGCDSIMTINLTINNSTSSAISQAECFSYTAPSGTILTTSGAYSDTIPNTTGCDSIMTINLTINTIDTAVIQSLDTLTSNESGAIYQWLDCSNGNAINGDTVQSFTAVANGSYAVAVTKNGCTDTSGCYNVTAFGLIENSFGQHIALYPNPSKNDFTIDLGKNYSNIKIEVTEIKGKLVYSQKFKQSQIINIDINQPAGVYFLSISSGKDKAIFRLIKTQ